VPGREPEANVLPLPRTQYLPLILPLLALLLPLAEGSAADSTEVSVGSGEYLYVEDLPEAIKKVAPDYSLIDPDSVARGTVLIQALVGKDGRVGDTKVVKSVPGLDSAAVAAVRQWEFKPAMTHGKPVAVWVAVPIRFEGKSGESGPPRSLAVDSTRYLPSDQFPDRRKVVSRFMGPDLAGDAVTGVFPSRAANSSLCEWWLTNPNTMEDVIYLSLRGAPANIRWNTSFTHVEYRLGPAIYRVDWRLGAEPVQIAELPFEEGICDFWFDEQNGRLRIVALEFDGCVATTWEKQEESRWEVVKEAPSYWMNECSCLPVGPPPGAAPMVYLSSLLDSMRIQHHRAELIGEPENRQADERVFMPSRFLADIGFEMDTVFGDSNHALWPVNRVDQRSQTRRRLFRHSEAENSDLEQIGLQEERGFLLIAEEYNGRDAMLYDTLTGGPRFSFGPHSMGAVWVPAPLP
jgi:TonB family protein